LAARQGYSNVYLYQDGIKAWVKTGNKLVRRKPIPNLPIAAIPVGNAKRMLDENGDIAILDIRDKDQLPKDKPILLVDHLAMQVKIVSPLLKSKGYNILGYVDGGTMAWAKEGLKFKVQSAQR
jgi:rhodanese-related sulfurtransferase